MRPRFWHAAALAAALSGCAVPPAEKHETPQLELPATTALPEVAPEWWKNFGDAKLDALVVEALANNRDLGRAMARIDESRAALRAARANQLPNVNANLSAARQHFGPNAPLTIGGGELTFNDFRANIGISYELDLWSRAAHLSATSCWPPSTHATRCAPRWRRRWCSRTRRCSRSTRRCCCSASRCRRSATAWRCSASASTPATSPSSTSSSSTPS
jgi:hypothetical protein